MKRLASLASAAFVLLGLVQITASQSAGAATTTRCSPISTKQYSGTIQGEDGRDINAQISFDLKDSSGRGINMNGCVAGGYAKTLWINMNVSGNGVVHSSATVNTWRLTGLPANAATVWIEVWTRTNTPKPCPTCDGPVDTHRYGFINRRAIPVNRTGIKLIAPLHCGLSNGAVRGSSANIQGKTLDKYGKPVVYDRIYAWSMLNPDGSMKLQGWGQAKQNSGYYVVDNLAPGQPYAVWATYHGVTMKRLFVNTYSCKATPLSFKSSV